MPSDRYYDEMDAAEDRAYYANLRRIKEDYESMFSKMTLEEKVDFLLEEFVKLKLNEQKKRV